MKRSATTNTDNDMSLEQSYVLTEHWKSDLEFYKVELLFLSSLINKYFVWLIKDNDLSNTKLIAARLSEITRVNAELKENVIWLMSDMKAIIDGSAKLNHSFREEYAKFEEELASFLKSFRAIKKDIFKISEAVMQDEKVKKLVS